MSLWELKTENADNALVPLRLFSHRVMAAGGGATYFIGMVFFPVATFLSLVVGVVLVHGASSSSETVRDILYFLVIPLVFGAALGGQLLTRLPYRVVTLLGHYHRDRRHGQPIPGLRPRPRSGSSCSASSRSAESSCR